jgi:hypothetical protein
MTLDLFLNLHYLKEAIKKKRIKFIMQYLNIWFQIFEKSWYVVFFPVLLFISTLIINHK